MNTISAQDGATKLLDIALRVFSDGGDLLNMSAGQFGCLLFGILLPTAVVTLIISAGLALSQHKKGRIAAIVFLCLGVVAIAAFLILSSYALICGKTWAHIQ